MKLRAALFAALVIASPAQAHVGFGASQIVTIRSGVIDLDLRVARDHVSGWALPITGPIPAAGAAALQATGIFVGGAPCAGEVTRAETRRAANIVVVHARFKCSRSTGPYRLDLGGAAALGLSGLQYVTVSGPAGSEGFLRGSSAVLALDTIGRGAPMIAPAYFLLGIEHIALGVDHLAFLLALLLAARTARRAFAFATLFAIAHTTSLVATVMGWVAIDAALVEPLIALSIAIAALDALAARPSARSYAVAGGFGLVHGLGFGAGVAEAGLPQGAEELAVISFTAGIEAAQLALLVLADRVLARVPHPAVKPVRRVLAIGLVALGAGWCIARVAFSGEG